MNTQQKEDILKNYYFNSSNIASYRGSQTLYAILNKKYPGLFTKQFIRQWLDKQTSYATSKQVRRKFRMAQVRVSSIDEQFDADLMSVGNLSKENDGIF